MASQPPVSQGTTPYETEYRYDIQWMIDTYEVDNLSIDNFLATLIIPKALALYYSDRDMIGESSNLDSWVTKMINLYNKNKEIIGGESLSSLGDIKPKSMRL